MIVISALAAAFDVYDDLRRRWREFTCPSVPACQRPRSQRPLADTFESITRQLER